VGEVRGEEPQLFDVVAAEHGDDVLPLKAEGGDLPHGQI